MGCSLVKRTEVGFWEWSATYWILRVECPLLILGGGYPRKEGHWLPWLSNNKPFCHFWRTIVEVKGYFGTRMPHKVVHRGMPIFRTCLLMARSTCTLNLLVHVHQSGRFWQVENCLGVDLRVLANLFCCGTFESRRSVQVWNAEGSGQTSLNNSFELREEFNVWQVRPCCQLLKDLAVLLR